MRLQQFLLVIASMLVSTGQSFAQPPRPTPVNPSQPKPPQSAAQSAPLQATVSPAARTASQTTDQPAANDNNLASPQMVAWLQQLIRENLPEDYEDTRKWDIQKEVWDGVDFSHDGLKLKTKRKHKLVNHGTWTRYRLELVEPDKNLNIQFHQLEVANDHKIHFHVSIEMLLDVFGRLSQWVRDVQVVSISANADATCRLTIRGTVAFQLNPLRFPPDIRIRPHVDDANVEISQFKVRRISQVGGPLAEKLGNGLRRALENKLEDSNAKLPEKMNKQLEKHADKMQFSTQEWLQSKLPLPDALEPATGK